MQYVHILINNGYEYSKESLGYGANEFPRRSFVSNP